ncbi:MAG: type II toxin-antitoxin system RelE/ParE family toxin [Oscillospiraceae bacterium]|nr:type II toxin-antitoxin system RelE/ParE family toxin [Oscillospiraceae bacterium]
MYEIIFYEDEKGNRPVLDFMRELAKANGKDSRVRLRKVQDYINILAEYGATMGEPYMKHLDNEIWEIRPLRDRILFAGVVGGKYVLLHQFMKKTQKTPPREIEQAKNELADFKKRSGIL